MNCKPGDLAVLVRAFLPANLGKVCRVIKWNPDRQDWDIEFPSPVMWNNGDVDTRGTAYDDQLRPIRDQDGDESFIRKVSVDDQINVLRKINQRKVKA
jgi:hypothetical protein